jgi:hypothetical protein
MRSLLVPAVLTLAAFATGCGGGVKDTGGKAAWTEIGTEDLAKKIQAGEITVIDNNPATVYEKRRLPGAKNLPAKTFETKDLPADKAAPMVFYCMNEG